MDETRLAFGEALRVAVANRGLSLRRVQAHLGAAGHPVALSTLSQWQHGRRVPASPRSLAVVEELERVPAGTLRALLDDANSVLSEGYYRWSAQETALLVTEVSFDRAQLPTRVDAFHRPHPFASTPAHCPTAMRVVVAFPRGDAKGVGRQRRRISVAIARPASRSGWMIRLTPRRVSASTCLGEPALAQISRTPSSLSAVAVMS